METQCAVAQPGECDEMSIFSSTQYPANLQHRVANLLAVAKNQITVNVKRLGEVYCLFCYAYT